MIPNPYHPFTRRLRQGFTLVEILATMAFMAILIPTVIESLVVANRAGQVAQRKRVAARLADSKLNELIATGQWETGNNSGNFGSDYPGYRWTLTQETWSPSTSMRQLSLETVFTVQGRPYSVRLTTLVPE